MRQLPALDNSYEYHKVNMVDHSSVPPRPAMPANHASRGPDGLGQYRFPLRAGLEQLLRRDITQTGYAVAMMDSRHASLFLGEGGALGGGAGLLGWMPSGATSSQVGYVHGPRRGRASKAHERWFDGSYS